MTTARERFQVLLKRLFQFNSSELDFGIYRIMNQKRAALEQFIETDLLEGVTAVLSSGSLAREAEAASRFSELCTQIRGDYRGGCLGCGWTSGRVLSQDLKRQSPFKS